VDAEAALGSRLRRVGSGRKRRAGTDPDLLERLERLVDPVTRGDPDSPLRWTCKSTTQLLQELRRQGHAASPRMVGRLLHAAGYSLQNNRKTQEDASHPDRNAQWRCCTNGRRGEFLPRATGGLEGGLRFGHAESSHGIHGRHARIDLGHLTAETACLEPGTE
jgi:transposase